MTSSFTIRACWQLEGEPLPSETPWPGELRLDEGRLRLGRAWDGPGDAPHEAPPPAVSPCGRYHGLLQGRVDRADELRHELGLSAEEAPDAEALVLAAVVRWGAEAIGRIYGAWVAIVWDGAERRLMLLRDGLGEAVLHVRREGPRLHVDGDLPRLLFSHGPRPDLVSDHLLDLLVLNFRRSGVHVFAGCGRVEPGRMRRYDEGGGHELRGSYHPLDRLLREGVSTRNEAETVEAMEGILREAVRRRLPLEGPVALHLSSGLDSGSVLGVLLGEEAFAGRIHACAMTPAAEGRWACPPGRCFDELPAVRRLVARCPGVTLHPVEYANPPYLDRIRASRPFVGSPNMFCFNHAWYDEMTARAAAAGASVVLAGLQGNFAYSHCPHVLGPLNELRVRRGEPTWGPWSAAKGIVRGILSRLGQLRGGLRQATLERMSLARVDGPAGRAALERRDRRLPAPALPPSLRWAMSGIVWRSGPGFSFGPEYWRGLARQHGAATVDPYTDRELVEFSFTLSDDSWLVGGRRRGVALEVWRRLHGPDRPPDAGPRGFQTANWVERLVRSLPRLRDELGRWQADPLVSELIDLPRLEGLFSDWEAGRVEPLEGFLAGYHAIGRAVSIADFIVDWHGRGAEGSAPSPPGPGRVE